MNQTELEEVLQDKYCRNIDKNYTILVEGSWGIGKSYCWQSFVNSIKDNSIKPIYISLFGIDSIDSISKEIALQFISKYNTFVKKIMEKPLTQKLIEVFTNKYLGSQIDVLSFFTLNYFNKEYLVCFDDLERKSKKINMGDILGVIEKVSLQCKVLVISSTKDFEEEDKVVFKRFKEKVVDLEYIIDRIDDETIDSLVNDYKTLKPEFCSTIIETFKKYGDNNLRTLNRILLFVSDLSYRIELNQDLVKICCVIMIENTKNPDALNESSFRNPYQKGSIFQRYFIQSNAEKAIIDIYKYLKTNSIEKDVITDFISPKPLLRGQEIIFAFQNAFLSNKEELISIVEEIEVALNQKNTELFNSYKNILIMWGHAKQYIKKLSLNKNIDTLEMLVLENIKLILEQKKEFPEVISMVSLMSMLQETMYTDIEKLVDKVNKVIEDSKLEYYYEYFKQSLADKDYNKCLFFLRSSPRIILKELNIFDGLVEPKCTFSYFAFVSSITDVIVDNKINNLVIQKLLQLRSSTTDEIKLQRVNEILKAIEPEKPLKIKIDR